MCRFCFVMLHAMSSLLYYTEWEPGIVTAGYERLPSVQLVSTRYVICWHNLRMKMHSHAPAVR
jgi:hypothetical protein